MNEWQQIARFWIVCMLFACAIALISCASHPILIVPPSSCAASAPEPEKKVEEEPRKPTYWECVDECERPGLRPVGVLKTQTGWECQCAPFDA